MEKLDKIKSIIAFVIVGIVLASFVVLGQNHVATRYLAVAGIILWLITMFVINKAKKDKEK